jgi:hypothetical protein
MLISGETCYYYGYLYNMYFNTPKNTKSKSGQLFNPLGHDCTVGNKTGRGVGFSHGL